MWRFFRNSAIFLAAIIFSRHNIIRHIFIIQGIILKNFFKYKILSSSFANIPISDIIYKFKSTTCLSACLFTTCIPGEMAAKKKQSNVQLIQLSEKHASPNNNEATRRGLYREKSDRNIIEDIKYDSDRYRNRSVKRLGGTTFW